jgi:hypothetical protein
MIADVKRMEDNTLPRTDIQCGRRGRRNAVKPEKHRVVWSAVKLTQTGPWWPDLGTGGDQDDDDDDDDSSSHGGDF